MILTRLEKVTAYRMHTPKWAFAPASGAGAAQHGGRANRPGVAALYLALDIETAVTEYRQVSTLLPPGTLVSYQVTADRIADFREGFNASHWEPIWEDFYCDWRELWFNLDRPDPSRGEDRGPQQRSPRSDLPPMIHAPALLKDLQRLLKVLEDDLRLRIGEDSALGATLEGEWQIARTAGRTGETYAAWLEADITQAAVHWLLSGVFVRFIEDNGLIARPWLASPAGGENNRLALARDRHEGWFRARPHDNDRDYLLACLREVGQLPGLEDLFDERHNPVFRLGCSGDAAMALIAFWQKIDPDSGLLVHDFTDPEWNTRFLGDLYQDLSEATRKRYALLQTPEFVEEFILDRTLTPALDTFGYQTVRLIDPTCGSGHFLLGAFARLLAIWARNEPGRNPRDTVQQALDGVYGVDLNPFAVAIARFRLLVAALAACDIHSLSDAPNFQIHLAVGDSLLHGPRFGLTETMDLLGGESYKGTSLEHAYATEDLGQVNAILGQRYHAVVGNPPYITVKDAALNAAYRSRYSSCHRQYSLGVPFTERFFELAIPGDGNQSAGHVGLITANSFMKKEFGSKLIEDTLPRLDITHIIDTGDAYIPGNATASVILFGRDQQPVNETIRTVMSIKGEPTTPIDPAQGLVWRAIVDQVDLAGSHSIFISVADVPRSIFAEHPWSIAGGGASDLKEAIESASSYVLGSLREEIGRTTVVGEDDIWIANQSFFQRRGIVSVVPLVIGECVRDWLISDAPSVYYPYESLSGSAFSTLPDTDARHLWPFRSLLDGRTVFGKTMTDAGKYWYEHLERYLPKLRSPLSISFPFVSTHNHFVLDRGGKVFKQTAPIIKLPARATKDDHLSLMGSLNSSSACFWMKQVFFPKKGSGIGRGIQPERWMDRYECAGTGIEAFPVTDDRPLDLAQTLDRLAQDYAACLPAALIGSAATAAMAGDGYAMRTLRAPSTGNIPSGPDPVGYASRTPPPPGPEGAPASDLPTATPEAAGSVGGGYAMRTLRDARVRSESIRRQQIAWQEELDWRCYRLYGLLGADADYEHPNPPEIALGERAFEIVLARRIAAGEEETSWFTRHGSTPITEIPDQWPAGYRQVVESRIALIESDKYIGLIERPEYKRRWAATPWLDQEQAALKGWLLDRLETAPYWPEPMALTSTSRLADRARRDPDFMQVAEIYAGRPDFDPSGLVAALVAAESVPFLPVLRYSGSGLRKREQWEATWDLQRREDAGEPVGAIPGGIPVPPKYKSTDFLKPDCWRLRGGLDVPKERWVSYPGAERGADGSLVIAWAGWNHLQQATALAAYYLDMKEGEAWEPARLQPLLAGLLELIPWLKQWHNDYDAEHATRMGDYFAGFIIDEARALGLTLDDLRAWKPAAGTVRRGRRKAG